MSVDYSNKVRDFLGDRPFQTVPNENGDFFAVTKSTREGEGKWQVTRFDKEGPYNHRSFDDYGEAIDDVMGSMKSRGMGSLDEVIVRKTKTPIADEVVEEVAPPTARTADDALPEEEIVEDIVPPLIDDIADSVDDETREQIGKIVERAIRKRDFDGLAKEIEADPERLRAAKEEGVEHLLQADHVSSNQAFQELSQLLKSQKGSSLRDEERKGLIQLGERGVDILRRFGATENLGGLSDEVRSYMNKTISELRDKAEGVYSKIADKIDEGATVDAELTMNYLEEKARKLGGEDRLTGLDSRVYKALKGKPETQKSLNQAGIMETTEIPDPPTYFLVDELRKEVGEYTKPTAFSDPQRGKAKVLYELLSGDQGYAAKQFGASELWKEAKALVKQRKGLEDDARYLFGKKIEDSFINKIMRANEGLNQTDLNKFKAVMKAVPESYRREVKASTLFKNFNKKGKDVENGPLIYKEFSDWYKNLGKNPEAKDFFFKGFPKEARRRMDNFATIAEGVAEATKKYTGTGASLQQYFKPADGLLRGIMHIAADGSAVGGGFAFGGPAGGILAAIGTGMIRRRMAKKPAIDKAADDLLSDTEFQKSVSELATGNETVEETAKKLSKVRTFNRFAKLAGAPKDRAKIEKWAIDLINNRELQESAVGMMRAQTENQEDDK